MCRGVITRDVLTEDDQRVLPCMAVPDSLTITRDVAAAGLDSVLSPLGFTSLERFSDELQVALFLAAERRKGAPLPSAAAATCCRCVPYDRFVLRPVTSPAMCCDTHPENGVQQFRLCSVYSTLTFTNR